MKKLYQIYKYILIITILFLTAGVTWVKVTDNNEVMRHYIATGKKLYKEKKCDECHGLEGKKPSVEQYPHVAGQPADYLATQIKDIQSGTRQNGMTSIMKSAMTHLKADEIDMIAEYLASVTH